MRDVRLLIKNGVILTSAIILAGGLSFTSFAATDDPTSGEGDGAATTETVAQRAVNSEIGMGYDTQGTNFNIFGIDGDGQEVQSTYNNAGYNTYVNNTNARDRVGATGFEYGTPYTVNGLETTITPSFTDTSVALDYFMTNVSGEDQSFKVGSNADTEIGDADDATIIGDGTGVTMYDHQGRGISIQPSAGSTFDHLWYGEYNTKNANTFTEGIQTGELSGVDSEVAWSWSFSLPAGDSTHRGILYRISDHIIDPPTPVNPTTPTTEKVYQEWGPGPEPMPRVWYAWTEKGEQLPITNMGTADATTSTLYIDISGASTVQYKDVIKEAYAKAPAGGVFVIGTSTVSVIDKEMAENFATRKDVTVKFVFPNGDQLLCVTTPAGFDFGSVLDETGFAGYLKLGATCGSSVIG